MDWKTAAGWTDYELSTDGQVRRKGKIDTRKLYTDKNGYKTVCLSQNGKAKVVRVHHLMLDTFVGPREEGQEARHLNGDPGDNRIENLEWCDHRTNCLDKLKHGTNGQKLTPDDVRTIRKRIVAGDRNLDIAADYGIDPSTVCQIKSGRIWSSVS